MGHIEDAEIVSGVRIVGDQYISLCKVLLTKYRPELVKCLTSFDRFESFDDVDDEIRQLNAPHTRMGLNHELLSSLHIEMRDNPTVYSEYHERTEEQGSCVTLFPYVDKVREYDYGIKENIIEAENKRYIKLYYSNNCVIFGITTLVLNTQGWISECYSHKLVDIDCRDSLKLLLERFFIQSDIDIIMTSYGNYIHY
jgi:hypothetical protein